MRTCGWVEFLMRVLPFNLWRDYLIRSHVENCPHCQAGLLNRQEARSLMITEDDIGARINLWPKVRGEIQKQNPDRFPLLMMRRRWRYGLAGALLVFLVGVWLFTPLFREKGGPVEYAQKGFQIQYIKVGNRPARTFQFQPANSDMIFVWAEKESTEEGYYD